MDGSYVLTDIRLQPDNPTDRERHALTFDALYKKGRSEDYNYVTELLDIPPDITTIGKPGQFKGIRVGIIGGGMAGMAAAFELRKLGFDITVFEADEKRVGGRVYTYYFNEEKTLYGELGAMRIPVMHEATWHYINLFSLNTRPFIMVNRNALIHLHGITVRNDPNGNNVKKYIYPAYKLTSRERQMSWQQLVFYGLEAPLFNATPYERSEILRILQDYRQPALYWDKTNIRQILQAAGLSNDAISLISSMVPLAGEFLYNNYIDFIQEGYPADISYLYEIKGGTSELPLAFYNSFIDNSPERYYPGISPKLLGTVAWKAGNMVTGIFQQERGGRVILEYGSIAAETRQREAFDYVICTIPFSTLRTVAINPLFSNMKMQAIKEVTYVPSQKTVLLCSRRFWEEGGPNERILGGGTYTDLPVTMVWYPSDHAKYGLPEDYEATSPIPGRQEDQRQDYAQEPGVLLASYNFNLDAVRLGNMPEESRTAEIKRELDAIHHVPKGYLNGIVQDMETIQWDTHPFFRGAFCFFTPEQKRIFAFPMTLPEYDGRVFFAGEHISPTHRWIQGALKTGMEAANSIVHFSRLLI